MNVGRGSVMSIASSPNTPTTGLILLARERPVVVAETKGTWDATPCSSQERHCHVSAMGNLATKRADLYGSVRADVSDTVTAAANYSIYVSQKKMEDQKNHEGLVTLLDAPAAALM